MINPNISKLVLVTVPNNTNSNNQTATYTDKGVNYTIPIHSNTVIKAGIRRLYLKYSILLDQYYLTK